MMRFLITTTILLSLTACAVLPGVKPAGRNHVYLLETRLPAVAGASAGCGVVVVNPPENAPGQSGAQMLYQRHPNQIERFAFSRWAASPAMMLEPLLLDALRVSARYSAVLSSPAPVSGDLRVENDGLWLIQRFDDERSFVELRMSSRIYAPRQRQLLNARNFSYTVPASEQTPDAGVAAADNAVRRLLQDFSEFVAAAATGPDGRCAGGI
ncbi:MAG: PqiC family protein [Gammaproteobacteria bacterium]|nr:PqiC family protein [Gammaproteobacteria bacterium]